MPLAANHLVLPPPRLYMARRLLQPPRVHGARDPAPVAGLLVEGGVVRAAVVPLEATALQVHARDRDGRVLVGQDIQLCLQVCLHLLLQDLSQVLA
ncbi:hypothetical protein BJX65DRAFT_130159 [Aspergillus insuetus]